MRKWSSVTSASETMASQASEATGAEACALSEREQTRNLVLVGVNTGLSYLASPVLYVGVVHAALGDELQVPATVSNLPGSAYLVMSALPLFVSWLWPRVAQLKPLLVVCYSTLAAINAVMAASLWLPVG